MCSIGVNILSLQTYNLSHSEIIRICRYLLHTYILYIHTHTCVYIIYIEGDLLRAVRERS